MSNKSLIMYIGTAISCVLQFLIYKLHSTDQDGINNTVYWRYRTCTGIILNVPYRTTQEEERIGLTTRTPRKYDLERIKEQKMTAAVRYKYRYRYRVPGTVLLLNNKEQIMPPPAMLCSCGTIYQQSEKHLPEIG